MKEIIAQNLKRFREASGCTQDVIASLLGIGRSAYSNYELGEREMPLNHLEKVADFFGCELSAMFNEQASEEDLIICAFRINDISQEDAEQIAQFKGLVKNYLKMQKLLNK
ncbi:MAG: helix-turn-helix transcriptional regulator [Paludibacteraceae bacterium]|nr:helix-turn-helix transcriptional regulator [Paludibacteraceae bacterium]MBR5189142.1 helix-turn-helix transcriptional regulator [Paludibacteraceae bacterium]MBR6520725.1 helix-turn-helix transcriptional regulator [Paludibacteraceae bacterium]